MNKYVKVLLFALLAAYVVSPADLCPGPVDDILAILVYFAANRNSLKFFKKNEDTDVIEADIN